jgi:hypothetical protein
MWQCRKTKGFVKLRNRRPKVNREPNASSDLVMAVTRHTARLGAAENVQDMKHEAQLKHTYGWPKIWL